MEDAGLGEFHAAGVTGMVVVMPGEVPQVTAGSSVAASMWSSRSNFASGSEGRVFQWATASSHAAPCGEKRRPLR